MSRDRSVYILCIHDCIRRIEAYTQGGRDEFFRDTKTQDAVIRNLEIIGQAVKDMGTDKLKTACADMPWEQIAGMRNILPHQYLGIDLQLAWGVVENDLPRLRKSILEIAQAMGIALL